MRMGLRTPVASGLIAAAAALGAASAALAETCPTFETSPSGVRLEYPNGNVDVVRPVGGDLVEIQSDAVQASLGHPVNLWLGGVFHVESRLEVGGAPFMTMDRQPDPSVFLPLEPGASGRFELTPLFAFGAQGSRSQGAIEVAIDVVEARTVQLASGCTYDIVIVQLTPQNQVRRLVERETPDDVDEPVVDTITAAPTPPTFIAAAPSIAAPLVIAVSLDELSPARIAASLPLSATPAP